MSDNDPRSTFPRGCTVEDSEGNRGQVVDFRYNTAAGWRVVVETPDGRRWPMAPERIRRVEGDNPALPYEERQARVNAWALGLAGELQPQSVEGESVPPIDWKLSDYRSWPLVAYPAPVGDQPVELPLSKALGPSWRFFRDDLRDTTVLLHDSGLWLEADAESLWGFDAQAVEAVRGALEEGVRKGISGRCMLETVQRQTLDPENPGRVLVDELLARVVPVPTIPSHGEAVAQCPGHAQCWESARRSREPLWERLNHLEGLLERGAQLLADAEPSELQRQWLSSVRAVLAEGK